MVNDDTPNTESGDGQEHPRRPEAIERGELFIHGLMHGMAESIEEYLENIAQHSENLDHHEAKIKKAETLAAIQEAENVLTTEIGLLRETIERYRAELDQARQVIRQQQEQLEQLSADATHDFLTQIPNRRSFENRLAAELARFQRYNHVFSLVLLDLDHFKEINDTFGHIAGDRILRTIPAVIAEHQRQSDFIARYGGEEFAIILPGTKLDQGMLVAEKVLHTVENANLIYEGHPIRLTVSAGVAECSRDDRNIEELIQRADSVLYRAKEEGRNLVVGATAAGEAVMLG